MSSNFKNNKPQSEGSAYLNLPKNSPELPRLQAVVDWLTQNGATLSFSIGGQEPYDKYIGFFNQYKRPGRKDPDVIIRRPRMETPVPQQPAQKAGFRPQIVNSNTDTFPL